MTLQRLEAPRTPSPTNASPPTPTTAAVSGTPPTSSSPEPPSPRSEASTAVREASSDTSLEDALPGDDEAHVATPGWQLSSSSDEEEAASGSNDSMGGVEEQRNVLWAANINFDQGVAIPEALLDHVKMLKMPRDNCSPQAEKMTQGARAARLGNEMDAHIRYSAIMLLASRDEGGHAWNQRLANVAMEREWAPPVTCKFAQAKKITNIPQAQADTATGYIPRQLQPEGDTMPFTDAEHGLINNMFKLHPKIYFPFHSVQWKREQSVDNALPQAARDGAFIVNHLRTLFSGPAALSDPRQQLVYTSHISFAFDGRFEGLFIHWYDPKTGKYNMEEFEQVRNAKLEDASMHRRVLRNLEDWAMDSRLKKIKEALAVKAAGITGKRSWEEVERG